MRPQKFEQLAELCEGVEADHPTLIRHMEIQWLLGDKVASCFYELWEELLTFCL